MQWEDEIPLRTSKWSKSLSQFGTADNGRINANVLLEHCEIDKRLVQAKGWHVVADARLGLRRRRLDGGLNRQRDLPHFEWQGREVFLVRLKLEIGCHVFSGVRYQASVPCGWR